MTQLKWTRIRWIVARTYGLEVEQLRARREYMLAVRRAEGRLALLQHARNQGFWMWAGLV